MLAKARHYVPYLELKNIYHAIFSSHLMYGAQVWTSKLISVSEKISRLQKRAVRIMTFAEFKAHSEPLFKQLGILKFEDNIELSNCLFVHDFLLNNLPDSYIDMNQAAGPGLFFSTYVNNYHSFLNFNQVISESI